MSWIIEWFRNATGYHEGTTEMEMEVITSWVFLGLCALCVIILVSNLVVALVKERKEKRDERNKIHE